jgi:hypothetical protein
MKQRLHHQKPIGSRAERLKGGSGGSQGQYTIQMVTKFVLTKDTLFVG